MSESSHIVRLVALPVDFDDLCCEAALAGIRFLGRLRDEWRSGENRFAGPGEVFLGAFQAGHLVGVGGLNRDPYADRPEIGRLRHLYVMKAKRRSGLGSALVRQLIAHAGGVFPSVRLRTESGDAAAFYQHLGFQPLQHETASHVWLASPAAFPRETPDPSP